MPEDELLAFEDGRELPTLGILQRMAMRYEIALASLLMPNPLPLNPKRQLRDFRAFGGQLATDLAQETRIAIAEADDYADLLSEIRDAAPDLMPTLFVPAYQLSDSPEEVATAERKRLGVSVFRQFDFQDERQGFLTWRESVEEQGVFAYQLKLGADDSRGFSIWDDREVPIIVIDASEESYGPKVFTLWHEYAHILLRAGGISNQNRSDRTERFCNHFAASFLMPPMEFCNETQLADETDIRASSAEITRLARRFRVSRAAVALRMEELSIAQSGFYGKMVAFWGQVRRNSGGRASHEDKITNRLGGRYIETVLTALERNLINKVDAFEATRIKPQYFNQVRSVVAKRRAAYGRTTQ